MFKYVCSIADLKEEADKCILLCANCHRIEHSKDKQKIIEYYLAGMVKLANTQDLKSCAHKGLARSSRASGTNYNL